MTHHLKAECENELLATLDKRPQAVCVARQASPSEFVEITHPSQVHSSKDIPDTSPPSFTFRAKEIWKSWRLAERQCSPKTTVSN